MYKCKALSGGGSYYDEGEWEIKETPKSFMLKCTKTGFHFKEGKQINIKKEYYPHAKFNIDGEIVIYINKEGMPYIFTPII